jgi:hypothetical protein
LSRGFGLFGLFPLGGFRTEGIPSFLTVSATLQRAGSLSPSPKKGPKNSYEETMLWEEFDPGGGHVSVTNNRSSNRQERPMFKNQVIVSLATFVFSHTAVLLSRLYYEFYKDTNKLLVQKRCQALKNGISKYS